MFQNIVAVFTLIGILYAAQAHLLSRTVIPSVSNLAKAIDSPLFCLVELDLTDEGQMHIFNKLQKEKASSGATYIYKTLSPAYIMLAYIKSKDGKIKDENFIVLFLAGKGKNLINYYLSYNYTSVAFPRISNAKLYFSTNQNDPIFGVVDNVFIVGKSASLVKETIIKINKALSLEYEENIKDKTDIQMIENSEFSNFGGLILKPQAIKDEISEFFDDPIYIKSKEVKAIKDQSKSLLLDSETIYVLFDINKKGELLSHINIKHREAEEEIDDIISIFRNLMDTKEEGLTFIVYNKKNEHFILLVWRKFNDWFIKNH